MSRSLRPVRLIAATALAITLAACSTTVPEAAPAASGSASATASSSTAETSSSPVATSSSSTSAASEAPATTRTVTTEQGEVTVPADAQRIVVLNSNLAGYFYALDVPVLATIPEVPGPGGGQYPASWAEQATEDATVILPWGEDGFDYESILAQAPDLIIAGGQGFSASHAAKGYDRLAEIAPTVLVSRTLLTWQDQLDFIATDVLGVSTEPLLAAYKAKVAEVAAAITLPPTPVAYLVLNAAGTTYSLPENSGLPQTLNELGFTPAAVIADNPGFEAFGTGDSFEVSTELVSQVFTAPTVFVFGFIANDVDVAKLSENPIYAALPAFTGGHAYDLPSWAYRADYLRTMELLDFIKVEFS